MIDAELTSLLLHTPITKERAQILLFEPYRLSVHPLEEGEPVAMGEIPVQPYLYLAMPRVSSVSILEELHEKVVACQSLAGRYAAWLESEESARHLNARQ
jgi:hypothetical protein